MAGVMDQISLPFRIGLAVVLVVAAAWMLVLKPKPDSGATPSAPAVHQTAGATTPAAASTPASGATAPGTAGLGRAVQKAHGAVAASDASAATSTTAANAVGATTTPAAPASTPAATPSTGAVKKVAVPQHHVAKGPRRSTLLLFAAHGADDTVARQVVRSLAGPHVRTIIAPVARIDLYKRLIGSVQVSTSPTIIVIGPTLQAYEITGLPDRVEVQRALAMTHG
jgi:hypothetical protein